jgi:hypothetical protein
MAQDKINYIELWNPGYTSDITPGGDPPLWSDGTRAGQIDHVQIKRFIDDPDIGQFRFIPGAPLPLKAPEVLKERCIFKIHYGDPVSSWRLFRITNVNLPVDSGAVTVDAVALYDDLADVYARRTLSPSGHVKMSLALRGRTLTQALTEIFSSTWGLPSHFNVGTVESSIQNESVLVQFFGATFRQILRVLLSQITGGGEVEYVWDDANDRYDINIYREAGWSSAERSGGSADPDSRPVQGPGGVGLHNRLSGNYQRRARDFFNRVIPVSGPENEPITIAGALFYGEEESGGYLRFPSDTRVVGIEDQYVGLYLGNDDVGFFEITDTIVDHSSSGKNAIQIDGSEAGLVGEWVRFAIDSSGSQLVYVEDPASVAAQGIAERRQSFGGVSRFPNLLVLQGVAAAMDEGSGGVGAWLPTGVNAVGSPTTDQDTGDDNVLFGDSSLKVQASENDGIEIPFVFEEDSDDPLVSVWAHVRLSAGSLRLEIEDNSEYLWPDEEKAETNSTQLVGLAVGGIEPDPGNCKVRIIADEDSTVFYVDAVSVTRSTEPEPYADKMGPALMMEEAVRFLLEEGGELPPKIDTKLLDASAFDSSAEINPGSHVAFKDLYQAGTPGINVTARVKAVTEIETKFEGRMLKDIELSDRKKDFTNRYKPGFGRPFIQRHPNRGLPPIDRFVGGFGGLSCIPPDDISDWAMMPMIASVIPGQVRNYNEDFAPVPHGTIVSPGGTFLTFDEVEGLISTDTGATRYVLFDGRLIGESLVRFQFLGQNIRKGTSDEIVLYITAGTAGVYAVTMKADGILRVSVTSNGAESTVNVDSTLAIPVGRSYQWAIQLEMSGTSPSSADIWAYLLTDTFSHERIHGVQSDPCSGEFNAIYALYSGLTSSRFLYAEGQHSAIKSELELRAAGGCIASFAKAKGGTTAGINHDAYLVTDDTNFTVYDLAGAVVGQIAHGL